MRPRSAGARAHPRAHLRRLAESLRDVLKGTGGGLDVFIRLVALRCLDAQGSAQKCAHPPTTAELQERAAKARRILPDEFGREIGDSWMSRPATGRAVEMLWDSRFEELGIFESAGAAGWLYQYWVNCDKPRIAAKLAQKRGDKIAGRDLVSATCTYTQGELARFLLQNTLGAKWLAGRETSPARADCPYWIGGCAVAQNVDEMTVFDPACGSGHILLEAFDLLFAMHREERPRRSAADICGHILKRNLFGVDVDANAVRLTRIGLMLRCLQVDPRFGAAQMNVHAFAGKATLLGSLSRPRDGAEGGNPAERLLTRRYDVVVTNPPFVGFRKLGELVKEKILKEDPLAVSDMAVAFVSRCHSLLKDGGRMGIVAPAAWMTSSPAAPLRRHLLETGGPVVVAHLGQHVFDTAPLLFVSLAVVERSDIAKEVRVLRAGGGSEEAIKTSVRDGGDTVTLAAVRASSGAQFAAPLRSMISRPFVPLGELFTFVDGVWSGDNARDVREAWEVAPTDSEWIAASGGQGYRRWYAPIRRRIRAAVAADWPWIARRAGCLEYARVAGGKLAARMVMEPSAAIAGVVTMAPRVAGRELDALAVMNSRVGTLFLRRLVSGLNFNPGYAGQVPVPEEPMGSERDVERAVQIVKELAQWEAGCDDFGPRDEVEEACEKMLGLQRELMEVEGRVDETVREALGISAREVDEIQLPAMTELEIAHRKGLDAMSLIKGAIAEARRRKLERDIQCLATARG